MVLHQLKKLWRRVDETTAEEMMKIKLHFAFGAAKTSKDFLDSKIIEDEKVEIRNKVFIKRDKFNEYIIEYQDEKVSVSLNLKPGENYSPSYHLGFYTVRREYFSIIHSGEGDGWDIHRLCMSVLLPTIKNSISLIPVQTLLKPSML